MLQHTAQHELFEEEQYAVINAQSRNVQFAPCQMPVSSQTSSRFAMVRTVPARLPPQGM